MTGREVGLVVGPVETGGDERLDFPDVLRGMAGSGRCSTESLLKAAIDVMKGLLHLMNRQSKVMHIRLETISCCNSVDQFSFTYKARNDAPTQS